MYDVIIVGAGHAGCEAAHTAATLGSKVLLVTMNMHTIAQMSCNPAMGGVAKGQIVREIDALGGMSGIITDKTMIQFRMLNRSKGAAMWSPRCQSDRMRFAEEWRTALENNKNIDLWQEMVEGLVVRDGRVCGVRTQLGIEFEGKTVILTNGTFLNGLIHIGEKQFGGGRAGERAATGITGQLVELGFEAGRMKTGTPPRVDGRTINYEAIEEQKGDENPSKFSYSDETTSLVNQRSCYITYTNPKVHEILQTGFEKSPMFAGRIKGLGPRYCPSIEDKIVRFSERDRHQIFVEPEGWDTVEVYVNGFSTSLPYEVQQKALNQIVGFEKAKMFRPGYAIEYDFFQPTQLKETLETKRIENLYFAGQINGTTGYEEAACQGLMAGINAHQKAHEKEAFTLSRSDAYIGVLIDDLIHKGTDEPYRMFTSRAEYRILLRQDNADVRLTQKGFDLGLASETRLQKMKQKEEEVKEVIKVLSKRSLELEDANPVLAALGTSELKQKVKSIDVLKRPQVQLSDLGKMDSEIANLLEKYSVSDSENGSSTNNRNNEEILEQAEIQIKYSEYVEKEQKLVEKMHRLEGLHLFDGLDYHSMPSLSMEARKKLTQIQPRTLGQASRISGISPSDISVLMVYLNR
ncbi:tRNA uridine-5-carboxymethylaminomethyl(34) synthesis enzyme MnmG [Bernardetia sp. Wsw4-3y2]|uniref:tRNA uridine-5-carboxymethylaminomethyl(34) synthesis enzyme MnmG n=1 Tax=Bernardetia sp. Wsw4-3y2 TaxID=3127471 RepID=UPI0030D5E8D8